MSSGGTCGGHRKTPSTNLIVLDQHIKTSHPPAGLDFPLFFSLLVLTCSLVLVLPRAHNVSNASLIDRAHFASILTAPPIADKKPTEPASPRSTPPTHHVLPFAARAAIERAHPAPRGRCEQGSSRERGRIRNTRARGLCACPRHAQSRQALQPRGAINGRLLAPGELHYPI